LKIKSIILLTVIILISFSVIAQDVFAGSFTASVEDAASGTTVYKQPGDFVNIFVWSDSTQNVNLDYDSGIGYTGEFDTVTLNTGRNVLKFYILEDTSPGTYDIEVGSADLEVEVIDNPSLVIITNREKLFQRYKEDPEKKDGRVDELLGRAYEKAKAQRGIVYDLGIFDSMPDFPWNSYSEYSEEPLNSKMTDNSYAVAAGIFVESKCRYLSCKNVMVLGDDFVIPHYRRNITLTEGWLWWKKTKTETIYTDLSYIPVNRKPFSELDELFDRTSVIIVKPRSASTELEQEIIDLEEEIVEKYGNVGVSVISDHKITCNSFAELGGGSIFAKNLILVGDDTNNRAIACLPWVGGITSSMSIERNVWDFQGYAVVLETDGQRLDTVQTFRKILPMPDKRIFDFGRAVTACLWDGKFEGESALGQEIGCNMIPIVELAPDFRDSFKCWMASDSEQSSVDELVCGVNHFATGYDLVGYGAALVSFGFGGAVAEVGDSGVAVIKSVFRVIAKNVDGPIIDAAATVFKKGKKLKLVGGLLGMVVKNPKETDGLVKAWITVLSKGDDVAEVTFKIARKGSKWSGDVVKGMSEIVAKYGKNSDVVKNLDVIADVKGSGKLVENIAKQGGGFPFEAEVAAKHVNEIDILGRTIIDQTTGNTLAEIDVLTKSGTAIEAKDWAWSYLKNNEPTVYADRLLKLDDQLKRLTDCKDIPYSGVKKVALDSKEAITKEAFPKVFEILEKYGVELL